MSCVHLRAADCLEIWRSFRRGIIEQNGRIVWDLQRPPGPPALPCGTQRGSSRAPLTRLCAGSSAASPTQSLSVSIRAFLSLHFVASFITAPSRASISHFLILYGSVVKKKRRHRYGVPPSRERIHGAPPAPDRPRIRPSTAPSAAAAPPDSATLAAVIGPLRCPVRPPPPGTPPGRPSRPRPPLWPLPGPRPLRAERSAAAAAAHSGRTPSGAERRVSGEGGARRGVGRGRLRAFRCAGTAVGPRPGVGTERSGGSPGRGEGRGRGGVTAALRGRPGPRPAGRPSALRSELPARPRTSILRAAPRPSGRAGAGGEAEAAGGASRPGPGEGGRSNRSCAVPAAGRCAWQRSGAARGSVRGGPTRPRSGGHRFLLAPQPGCAAGNSCLGRCAAWWPRARSAAVPGRVPTAARRAPLGFTATTASFLKRWFDPKALSRCCVGACHRACWSRVLCERWLWLV